MRKLTLYILTLLAAWAISVGCTPEKKDNNVIQTMRALQHNGDLVVRFAKLEIDAARLEEYLSFLKEGIETSINTEPGVLTMYAVQEQDDPTKITILEMVKSLELIDLNPIVFGVRTDINAL